MRTSWNMLPFETQPINNFSSYDISQSVDWECPYLSPYVLLYISEDFTAQALPVVIQAWAVSCRLCISVVEVWGDYDVGLSSVSAQFSL